MIFVHLTTEDQDKGVAAGIKQYNESRQSNRKDNHGFENRHGSGLNVSILGMQGEIATARALNVPWEERICSFKRADLCEYIQVRTTKYPDGHLLFRTHGESPDPLGHDYYLVVLRGEWAKVVGHLRIDADTLASFPRDWFRDPTRTGKRPPAWCIPQSALGPVERNILFTSMN